MHHGWNGLWGPLGIETVTDCSQRLRALRSWNGLWGPLGIETGMPGEVFCCVRGWNGLWGPLGIETGTSLPASLLRYSLLEWLVGPVRD